MKKLNALLIVFVMVLSLVPMAALADDGNHDDVEVRLEDGTIVDDHDNNKDDDSSEMRDDEDETDDHDDVDDDSGDEISSEEASEEIAEAEAEIARAEEKIAEAEAEGKLTEAAKTRLEEARITLAAAQAAYDAGNFAEAEELAEDAKDFAAQARMKYLGKTLDEIGDDDEDETDDHDEEDEEDFMDTCVRRLLASGEVDSRAVAKNRCKRLKEAAEDAEKMVKRELRAVRDMSRADVDAALDSLKRGVFGEDFREFQKEKFMVAFHKCEERGKDVEKCQEKLEKRLELIEKLTQKDIERLEKIKEKKKKLAAKLHELEKDDDLSKFDKKKEFKARKLTKEGLKVARDALKLAKENNEKAKIEFLKKKDQFSAINKKLKACKGDMSEECEKERNEAKIHTKEILQHSATLILGELEKLASKVESSEDLTEEEASDILEAVETQIANVQDVLAEIEAITEESEGADVREIVEELKDELKDSKELIKKLASTLANERIAGVIVKSKHLEEKLHRSLEKLVENGFDISVTELSIEQFDAVLDEALAKFEEAKEKFALVDAAETPKSRRDALIAAQSLTRQAQANLKEAHQLLKDIVKTIRSLGGDDVLEEDESDDAVEEVEEEVEGEE